MSPKEHPKIPDGTLTPFKAAGLIYAYPSDWSRWSASETGLRPSQSVSLSRTATKLSIFATVSSDPSLVPLLYMLRHRSIRRHDGIRTKTSRFGGNKQSACLFVGLFYHSVLDGTDHFIYFLINYSSLTAYNVELWRTGKDTGVHNSGSFLEGLKKTWKKNPLVGIWTWYLFCNRST